LLIRAGWLNEALAALAAGEGEAASASSAADAIAKTRR
jgi:hypothetical protein